MIALACERKIVDEAYPLSSVLEEPERVFGQADMIILATPVRTILSTLEKLPQLCKSRVVVLDLGSTKASIMDALEGLPERFDAIGGHPMCGKEKSSLRNAEANLYLQAPFALVATRQATLQGRQAAEELARAVGASPFWIDQETHDQWVAATSHLPFLIASALAKATPEQAGELVGPGFRSTARLAGSSPQMMVDILATNQANVLAALARFRQQLEVYEELLAQAKYSQLAVQFQAAMQQYQSLTNEE